MTLFSKFESIRTNLDQVESYGRNPFNICFERMTSPSQGVFDGRDIVLFGTNNYLGLTFEPECVEAGVQALYNDGTGTTGSRIANGTYSGHTALEQQIAGFFGKADAMVFSTGYQANLGLISTIAGRGDYLLIDADSHASIYDACKLGSADVIRFRHNDPDDLARRMRRLEGRPGSRIIVTEGIYSMLGDIAPLAEIAQIKREAGAYLIVDEAHSLGVLGERGRGLSEALDVQDDVDFVVGTFSKSLGGVGGFAVSDMADFDVLRVACRAYMFTASLPPASIASASAALTRLSDDPSLGARVRANGERLHAGLSAAGFDVGPHPSPIVAVRMTDLPTAVRFWNDLLDRGFYVNLALPPATPAGMVLLRSSVTAAHSDAQIDALIEAMVPLGAQLGLIVDDRRQAAVSAR